MKNELEDFLKKHGINANQIVGGHLYLGSLTSIPEVFNPTVGGSLDLRSLTSIPEGFNPTVGGNLDLDSLTSIPEVFNPTVGGYLDLGSLTSIPEGFNPTVGGSLNLRSLTSIPEGFNPTVGGYLDLGSLTSIPEHNRIDPETFLFSWRNEKYIKIDGIFCRVLQHKRNVYKVCKIASEKVFYIVTDGNGKYSHGDTVREAKEDLIFKISNRDKSQYNGLTLESELSYSDAIVAYRVITGACQFGTKDFITNRLKKKQKSFTIAQMIEVTKGEYGNAAFAGFFRKEEVR